MVYNDDQTVSYSVSLLCSKILFLCGLSSVLMFTSGGSLSMMLKMLAVLLIFNGIARTY